MDGKKKPYALSKAGKTPEKSVEQEGTVKSDDQTADAKRNEEIFRELFNLASDSIFILDPSGSDGTVIFDANVAACVMHGYAREELIGKPISFLNDRESGCRVAERVERLRAGETLNFETKHIRKDGSVFTFEVSARQIKIHDRSYILAINRDITERKQAEQLLLSAMNSAQEEKAKSEAIIAALGDAISIQDTSYKILYQNQASKDIYGDHVGEHCYRSYQNSEQVCQGCHVTKTFEDGKIHKVEQSRKTDQGTRFYDKTVSPLKDPSGKIIACIELVRDVTDRKRSEREVAERGAMQQQIMDTASVGIGIVDRTGRIVHANMRMAEMFGRSLDELIGCEYVDLVHPTERELARQSMLTLLASRESSVDLERRYLRKDGDEFWGRLACRRFQDAQGNELGLVGVIEDITESKAAEDRIRESENKFRSIFEQTSDGIMIADPAQKRNIEANSAMCNMLGYTHDELMGLSVADLHPNEELPRILDLFERQVRGDISLAPDIPMLRKDGSVIYADVNAVLRTFGGKPCLIGVFRDITERRKADEALLESEKRYRTLFDQSPDGIVLVNPEGKLIEFNEAAHRALGYTREEFAHLNVSDLDPFENLDDVHARINKIIKTGQADFYVKHRTKQGELKDVHVITRMIMLSGRPYSHGIWHDVTEIKHVKDRLEEKNAEQNTILDNALAGIAFLKDRKLIWINSKMEQLFGYLRDEVSGLSTEIFYPSKERYDQLGQEAYSLIAGGETYTTEQLMKRKDGSVFWCSLSGKAIDPVALSKGSIWLIQDITAHKKDQELIRQNEQFIRSVLDTVDEGFIVIDRDYRILTVNKAYCSQVGSACDDIIGKHCFEVSHRTNKPCYEQGEACAVREVFATGEPRTVSHKHTDAAGNAIYVETKAYPMKDSDGTVVSAIETVTNITEKHLLEEERLKTQKLESIGTLAGGIAHDFNNLLQGIFGYIAMAKMTFDQKDKSLAMLEQAEKALHQSVNLTSQLLTFSKGGKPVKKLISLGPVIENSTKFTLSGSRSDFHLNIPGGLWQTEADEGQLGQVIQNIVLNADQSMPVGGSVIVNAQNIADGISVLPPGLARGNYIMISIQDTGVGIPEQYIDKIFDPYFTTKEKGSGLGLATSYSIIRNHGGVINVRTKPGEGSTFMIYLPAITGKGSTSTAARQLELLPTKKARVLVMDDEEFIRDLSRELLLALGHEVSVAKHGREALELYQEAMASGKPIDIVILDLTVRGGMGGAETIKKLLEIDPGLKAIVSSGYSDDAALADHLSSGFRASLTKPYNIQELRDILASLMS